MRPTDPGTRRGRHSRSRSSRGPMSAPARADRGRRGRGIVDGWILVLGALVIVAALVMVVRAIAQPRPQAKAAGVAHAKTDTGTGGAGAKGKAAVKSDASAVFANMKGYDVPIHFPAVTAEMVAVGFHQAWNTKATDIVPVGKPYPKDKYDATKAALKADPSLKTFLMMSRGRGSSEYSAADCAVKPGALILSPVSGEVTLVTTYKLAGVGTDYRVEIKADGADKVRVVMIHLKDVTVKAGERVEGGVTPIATVRHLPIDNQVNRYLPVPADHTHVQINAVGYKLNEAS